MNLENLGVQEMSAQEVKQVEGGIWSYIIGALIGELLDRGSGGDFANGFNAASR